MPEENIRTSRAEIFRGGIPYGPDIKKLREVYPTTSLQEGRKIPHDDIAKLLGYAKGSPRYYGVVNAWMRRERNDTGIFMNWDTPEGIVVLRPDEVLGHAEIRTRQKAKQFVKAVKLFDWVDRERLDETGQKRLDHHIMVRSRLKQAIESGVKELSVELAPVKSLPKRTI